MLKKEASKALFEITRWAHLVAEYAVDFRAVAADNEWNPVAMFGIFYRGFSSVIKDELAAQELPDNLNDQINLATRIN